jgi:hypothetical protein
VHDALGDPLAVEARELLEQVLVLEQQRAARACALRVLVVGDRSAGFRAKRLGHVEPSFWNGGTSLLGFD